MPALTPAQRKKQIELQRAAEAKRKEASKPKPGQKGATPSSGGAKTKAGTIGGGKTDTPRPTATTKPKPTPSNKPKPVGDGKGGLSKPSGTTGKPTAQPQARVSSPATDGRYIPGNQQVPFQAPQPLRSPAIGAPVHASPAAFGSAPKLAQSAYVGSSAASPARPSTPGQAAIQQAPNPFQGIGDIRGQQLPQDPVQQDAELSAGTQQYGGQQLQGIDQNGVDMERRRAFLDADNSLAGLKAVKELLNRRKLSISVES